MTTKTVLACKRLRVRGLALLGLVALAAGYAEAAAAGSRVVRGVQVSERDGRTAIDV